MEIVEPIDVTGWDGPFSDALTAKACAALESGKILLARLPFALSGNESRFLSPDCLDGKSKNVSFRPASGELHGTRYQGTDRQELLGMLRRYYEKSRALLTALCPAYLGHLIDGFTSFRPAEIAGRTTSWRKDDTRLHVDAFPSRPVQGLRILRVFSNLHPNAPRMWRVGEEFERVASKFLASIKPPLPGAAWLLQRAGVVKGRRTLYDYYMLGLHDRMKADDQYQAYTPQTDLAIPPGFMWVCFTDCVPHAAMSGQFACEQTYYLPVDAMREPARSPLRILERLTGRSMV